MSEPAPVAPADRIAFLPLRLSLFYGAYFLTVGILLPFWPVFLQGRGLGAREIGLVVAAHLWIKLLANPLAAQFADRRGILRGPILALAIAATAAYLLYLPAQGVVALFLVAMLAGGLLQPIMPLGDSLTLRALRRYAPPEGRGGRWLDYGRLRLWGSVTFIAASVGAGELLETMPSDGVLWLTLGALGLTVLVCALLPDLRDAPQPESVAGYGALLRAPEFALFLLAAGLLNASHGAYYGFATLHWRDAGIDVGTIGLLWAEGVVAEIVLFAVGGAVVARLGPVGMLVLAGLGGGVRWMVTAATTDLWALVAVQGLHGLTFGALHLGAIAFIQRATPSGLGARAQALYACIPTGVAMGLSLPLSGVLYAAHGGSAFLAMAGMSMLGVLAGLVLVRRWDGRQLAGPAA